MRAREREDHLVHQLILAHGPRDRSQRCIGRHAGNEVFRIESPKRVLAEAASQDRYVIHICVIGHRRQRRLGIAGGKLVCGVLFPQLDN